MSRWHVPRWRCAGLARRFHERVTPVPLTAGDVAAAVRGQIVSGGISAPIGRISIDSRGVAPGDFFVAIRGERFDGHHFVAAALAAGAG
ncbi:MAG: hypothetical protein H0W08_16420, partial [Acidobacteria bacterium]|nr:hypothetical protein [Acidobacteriota bacterium]